MNFIELFEKHLTYDHTFMDLSPNFIRSMLEVRAESDRVNSWDGEEFRGFLTLAIL